MGSLLDKCLGVTPKAAHGCVSSSYLNRLCSPRLAVGHYWGAQLIGEVPILEYVSERLWLMIRQDVNPDGWMQMLWYKSTTSAECKTIRVAAPAVMGSWKGHTVPLSDIFLNFEHGT